MPESPARTRLATATLVALLAACGDAPSGPAPRTTLRLCLDAPWVAYRNEGEDWTRAVPAADGSFTIDATPRLALVHAYADRPIPHLVVEYASADQAARGHACGQAPAGPPAERTLNGVVRGRIPGDRIYMRYGDAGAAVFGTDSAFTLPPVAGAMDLVAVRMLPDTSDWLEHADRAILRRAPAYTADSRIVLDFASAEAFALETGALRFTGPSSGVSVAFVDTAGRSQQLQFGVVGPGETVEVPRLTTLHMIPASRMQAGELHDVRIIDGTRTVELWNRVPRDLATRYGPPASVPAFRLAGLSPYMRVDARMRSQPDYGAFVYLSLVQSSPSRTAVISATREYFGGTPREWVLPFPDLAEVEGFPLATGFHEDGFSWQLGVSGRPDPFWVRFTPRDGQVFRSASASGYQGAPLLRSRDADPRSSR